MSEKIKNGYFEQVYEIVKKIPFGKVATYGQIAQKLGNVKLARVVGNALHSNPKPFSIKCYRVVNSKGKLSSSFAFGGIEEQKRLLESEKIKVINGKVDLQKFQCNL